MSMTPDWLAPEVETVPGRDYRSSVQPKSGERRPARDAATAVRGSSGASYVVETHDASRAAAFRHDWERLMARSLEPNVFMEPAFCLSSAQHMVPARRPVFVLVWDVVDGAPRRLVAVCPMRLSGPPFRAVAASWFHDLMALGGPLLDRDQARPAVEAILAWLGRQPGTGAWLIPAVPAQGPTAGLFATIADETARPMRILDRHRRAVLAGSPVGEPANPEGLSKKKTKEMARQRRRLEDLGTVAYVTVCSGRELRDAVEQFLLLEARGWKGRRGTALLMNPDRAAFTRTMTRLMARDHKCRVDALTLDGKPVAMGIVLSTSGRDYFWKMAYDEAMANLSPGVHLVLELTARQRRNGQLDLTDSCAQPDHPMIDRLWRDRLEIADLMVGLMPGATSTFRALAGLETARRRLRARLKQLVRTLRNAVRRRREHSAQVPSRGLAASPNVKAIGPVSSSTTSNAASCDTNNPPPRPWSSTDSQWPTASRPTT